MPSIVKDDSACSIATINPFRYRSYYFDKEIGMYYLQSRYYNPVVCRFINADEPCVLAANANIFKTNLEAYCKNDCINEQDASGYAISDYIHAIGVQLSLTIAGVNFGFEFLWSTKTWKFVMFFFAGVSGSSNSSNAYNIMDKYIVPKFAKVKKTSSSVMKVLTNLSFAVSFIAVIGSKRQRFPADYCGIFDGFSLSFKLFWINVSFAGAIVKNRNGLIGSACIGISSSSGVSLGRTYYIQLTGGKSALYNNFSTLFNTILDKIKGKMSTFEKYAKVLI